MKTKTILSSELTKIWKNGPLNHLQLICLDGTYDVLDEPTWLAHIMDSKSRLFKYSEPVADCDKFSFYLRGEVALAQRINGVITVVDFSGSHSYNAVPVLQQDGKTITIEVVEPQSDEFVAKERVDKTPYTGMEGLAFA